MSSKKVVTVTPRVVQCKERTCEAGCSVLDGKSVLLFRKRLDGPDRYRDFDTLCVFDADTGVFVKTVDLDLKCASFFGTGFGTVMVLDSANVLWEFGLGDCKSKRHVFGGKSWSTVDSVADVDMCGDRLLIKHHRVITKYGFSESSTCIRELSYPTLTMVWVQELAAHSYESPNPVFSTGELARPYHWKLLPGTPTGILRGDILKRVASSGLHSPDHVLAAAKMKICAFTVTSAGVTSSGVTMADGDVFQGPFTPLTGNLSVFSASQEPCGIAVVADHVVFVDGALPMGTLSAHRVGAVDANQAYTTFRDKMEHKWGGSSRHHGLCRSPDGTTAYVLYFRDRESVPFGEPDIVALKIEVADDASDTDEEPPTFIAGV